jgi:iron(III) transport system ATP-binding protein
MNVLTIENVVKDFGTHRVLDGVSLTLSSGEIGCLLGPSGCGKTTLLRIVAGFEDVTAGTVAIGGAVVTSGHPRGRPSLPPEDRGVGMVFQDYALFPHLTAAQNVSFGLAGAGRRERREKSLALLEQVGLANVSARYPHELSGGQQQRVALARALAPSPRLLLLDEPFSNLDVALRERLSEEVRTILKARGATAVMVSHNQQEAFAMADVVGVMVHGELLQWATPQTVYHRPADVSAAGFVGEGALIRGRVTAPGVVTCALGELRGEPTREFAAGSDVAVLVRPEDILHDDASPVRAVVIDRTFRGASLLYALRLDSGETVLATVSSHDDQTVGEHLGIRVEMGHLALFGPEHASAPKEHCALE